MFSVDEMISTREALGLFPLTYGALLKRAHSARVPFRHGPGQGRPLYWNKAALLASLSGKQDPHQARAESVAEIDHKIKTLETVLTRMDNLLPAGPERAALVALIERQRNVLAHMRDSIAAGKPLPLEQLSGSEKA